MYSLERRDNEEFCDNEKMLKKQFIYNLLVAWCVRKQTATNLIEPKVWPLLWMGWQEILHEVGHLHLARAVRGWPGSASGTERSHAIHGSASGTEQMFPFAVLAHPLPHHSFFIWGAHVLYSTSKWWRDCFLP